MGMANSITNHDPAVQTHRTTTTNSNIGKNVHQFNGKNKQQMSPLAQKSFSNHLQTQGKLRAATNHIPVSTKK